ncbi:MAG: hypothetical protein OXB99_07900 [Acidimicrobiaceae bacterium]|nr:hypothetical protein [Acidimicrobiaceae bacterium]
MSTDTTIDEQSRTCDLIEVDDHETLWTEWAKFAPWRSQGRLGRLVEELEFTSDAEAVIAELEHAIGDAQRAVAEMRSRGRGMQHYGG